MAKQNKGRKFFATTATAALVASAIVPVASAAEVNDLNLVPSWAKEAVQYLVDNGSVQGDNNGNFNPTKLLTRAQAAEILSKELDLEATGTEDYSDVASNNWFYNAVLATTPEIFNGNEKGEFLPNKNLTRQEAAKVLVEAYGLTGSSSLAGFPDASEVPGWAKSYLETAVANGVINGKGSKLAPTDNISNAEFATMVKRAIDAAVTTVTSVSATGPSTLTVSGTALKGLKAEDITVESNTVTAVTPAADGKSATLTLANKLTPGKEFKVTVKTEKETKDFTVKYTFDVNNVAITTTTLDDDKNAQKLTFTVNGATADLDYLKNVSGWTVQFQADEAVFENNGSAATTSATGEIREEAVAINDSFNVKVVLTKQGVTVESALVKVNVVNDNETPVIGSVALTNYGANKSAGTDDFTMKSTTLVTGEKAAVAGIYSNTDDIIAITGSRTYASSNLAVATVDTNGVITAIAPGTTTITVTAGKQSYKVNLTVTNTGRVVSKLTPEKSEVKVAPGVDPVVAVTTADQYGDPIVVAADDTVVVETSDLTPGELSAGLDGKGTITVDTGSKTAGTYAVYLKVNNVVLGQFNVTITSDNVANTPKLEASKTTVAKGSSLTLKANLYTTSGGYVESLTEGGTAETAAASVGLSDSASPANNYTVEVVDPTVASVATTASSADITVKGLKAGSTDIVLKNAAGIQVAKYTLTVTDNPVKVNAVSWKANNNTISTKGYDISIADALNITTVDGDNIVSGLTLNTTSTSKVRIDESTLTGQSTEAVIYLDKDDDGVNDGAGEVLGKVSVSLAPSATGLGIANIGAIDTTAVGDKGTLIFTFTDTVSSPAKVISSTTLNVDVK